MTDPNVQTNESGEEVILEPGDPGYVDPNAPTSTSGQAIDSSPETGPGPDEPLGEMMAPPGEDLTHKRDPNESDAEFLARTRGTAVLSESPTDIVPNTPQITMGPRVEVEGREGVVYAGTPDPNAPSPVETEEVEEVPEEEAAPEEEEVVAEEETKA